MISIKRNSTIAYLNFRQITLKPLSNTIISSRLDDTLPSVCNVELRQSCNSLQFQRSIQRILSWPEHILGSMLHYAQRMMIISDLYENTDHGSWENGCNNTDLRGRTWSPHWFLLHHFKGPRFGCACSVKINNIDESIHSLVLKF